MTNTLQRLESQGLVKVADDPKDARAKLVEITEPGKKAREQAIRALAPVLASLAGVIAPADVKSALPFLENLRKTLDERR
jgi:DNA-binding MarR family transcriptional regulator